MFNNFNPYKTAFHKFSNELLVEKYQQHADTIERIISFFPTERDITTLSQLFIQLYECGYLSATNQYVDELKRLGISVSITGKKTN